MKNLFTLLIFLLILSCSSKNDGENEIWKPGTPQNPITFYFYPSVNPEPLRPLADEFASLLSEKTGLNIVARIPISKTSLRKDLDSGLVDLALMSSNGYLQAALQFDVYARLISIRSGKETYRGQIITHVNSGIDSLKAINGRSFAFTDAASSSGYIFPYQMLNDANVKPSDIEFLLRHDNVVEAVYLQNIDAGATYYTEPQDGEILDARARLIKQYPDVVEKVKIIALTEPIPNDPVAFNNTLPRAIEEKIIEALKEVATQPAGKNLLMELYSIEGFTDATDLDYDPLRQSVN
ncbi:MAG TPA: phosphate/phosphite/phosphonate ABC transporter substrate-binding protein [Cyclobacteriaceae bacterium]